MHFFFVRRTCHALSHSLDINFNFLFLKACDNHSEGAVKLSEHHWSFRNYMFAFPQRINKTNKLELLQLVVVWLPL